MQEPEMIDRYIKETVEENRDFEVTSLEIWEFLTAKYGYDFEVRRYYHKG